MYGLLISSGILISSLLAERTAKKRDLNSDVFWDGLLLLLICGLVGARTYHVLDLWEYYSINPMSYPFSANNLATS